MDIKFQLKGDWDFDKTTFFLKSLFCRQIQYSFISTESLNDIKEFASLGAPFALIDYNKVIDKYNQEFLSDNRGFLRNYFLELKELCWQKFETKILVECLFDINGFPLLCSSQVVFLKLVRFLTVDKIGTIKEFEPIERMRVTAFDLNYYIFNELHESIDELFDIKYKQIALQNREFIVNELHDDLWIFNDNKFSSCITSITLKFEGVSTFQQLLDIIFNSFLSSKVRKRSYGEEWVLTYFNGTEYNQIHKNEGIDNRTLDQAGIMKGDMLKLDII
jgi:hypothetical protein